MSYRDYALMEGAMLEPGESVYQECPSCGQKGKFSITQTYDGLILWHCFSASCALHRGSAGSAGGRSDLAPAAYKKKSRPKLEIPLELPTEEAIDILRQRVGFDANHLTKARVRWCAPERQFAFPILSYAGARGGWVTRTWDKTITPKAQTYLDTEDQNRLSYYHNEERANEVVVVEDIPSAVRASRYTSAVALLGTSCSLEAAAEIASHYGTVRWALDADALGGAIRLVNEYRLLFAQSYVLPLERDLKDETERRLEEMLGG